jgi:serine phosphatase RsbU (regulator of sigma subunit)
VSADLNPTGSRFSLREDDLLVLATDGVIEQTNSSADAYGELRLAGIIKRIAGTGF